MADNSGWVAVYETPPIGGFVVGMAGLALALGAIVAVVFLVSGQARLFTLVWSAFWFPFWGGLAYGETFLFARTLATDGRMLRWSGKRRQGIWPLEDIAAVHRGWVTGEYISLTNTSGGRILVRPRKGWQDFLALITPGRPADPDVLPRRYERRGRPAFGWRNGWPDL